MGDRNFCSVIVEVVSGTRRFLIGGDADGRIWKRLLDDQVDLGCDVLKWPHHGAINAKGGFDEAALMSHAAPSHVVFSVGTHNRYGHPVPAAIQAAADQRMACTEVTKLCHEPLTGATPCGGTLSFVVNDDDLLVEQAGWLTLDSRVGSWSHPQCRQLPIG
jgi:hypothetical protein